MADTPASTPPALAPPDDTPSATVNNPPAAQAASGGRVKWLLLPAIALALIGCVGGGLLWTHALSADPQATGTADAAEHDRPTVQVIQPIRETVRRTCTQPATVHPYFEAEIYPRVGGYVKELNADIGTTVAVGQVLAVLDVPELESKRERQHADIARLEAEQDQAVVEVETARAQGAAAVAHIGKARAEVKKAEAQRAADQAEMRRIEQAAVGTLNTGVLNEVRSRYEAAVAGRQAAEAALANAEALSKYADAKVRLAEAAAKTAAARTEVARKDMQELATRIGFATLRAPFGGIVTTRDIDPGDLVGEAPKSAAHGPMFTVAHIDKLRLRVPVPERDAPLVKEGKPAEFRSDDFPGKVFPGTVSRSAGGLDRHTRTMLVEVDFDNRDRPLLPGMFGQLTLVLEERPNCLRLPTRALHMDKGSKAYVLAVDGADKVCRIDVTTGADDGQRIEILRGLNGDERVITAHPAALGIGELVHAIPEK